MKFNIIQAIDTSQSWKVSQNVWEIESKAYHIEYGNSNASFRKSVVM